MYTKLQTSLCVNTVYACTNVCFLKYTHTCEARVPPQPHEPQACHTCVIYVDHLIVDDLYYTYVQEYIYLIEIQYNTICDWL